jgi:hypothetical protein
MNRQRILEQWNVFRDGLPADMPVHIKKHMQHAFFAGGFAVFCLMIGEITSVSDEPDKLKKLIEDMMAEGVYVISKEREGLWTP